MWVHKKIIMIENSLATPASCESCQTIIFNSSQINPSFTTFRKKTLGHITMGKKVQNVASFSMFPCSK